MSYNTKNYTEQGGEKTVVGGEIAVTGALTVAAGATVTGIAGVAAAATDAALGGIKAAASGEGDTVEVKIDTTSSKLYVPTYPVLAAATEAAIGGIKAANSGEGDTVEVKIGAGDKLFVPAYPKAALVEEATGTAPTADQFNALLDALKAAGIMAAEAEQEA